MSENGPEKMSEQKQLLIVAGIVIAIMVGCFALLASGTGSHNSIADLYQKTDETGEDYERVTFDGNTATVWMADAELTIPAPTGYCFTDPHQKVDRELLNIMHGMQTDYGNHLWLAFVNCQQLDAVRASKDFSTYIDTGMLVTPVPYLDKKSENSGFVTAMRERLKTLNPVALETLINSATQHNISAEAKINVGQPVILRDQPTDLIFLLQHELSDPQTPMIKLTEFDIVTELKDYPMVTVLTYKDLTDPMPRQAFMESYLAQLQAANTVLETPGDAPDLH